MKYLKIIFCLTFISVSGCDTTGGIYKNLIPLPKFMKGEVVNNVYISQDGTFEINAPFKEGVSAYTYMEVKEQYYANGAYVSFLSSVASREVYRVEIGKAPSDPNKIKTLEDIIDPLLASYKQQLSNYGSVPVEVRRINKDSNGKRGMLVIMKQTIDGKVTYQILHIIRSESGAGGVAWVQWPGVCNSCENKDHKDVLAEDPRIQNFIGSFVLKI